MKATRRRQLNGIKWDPSRLLKKSNGEEGGGALANTLNEVTALQSACGPCNPGTLKKAADKPGGLTD